jgi:hypothetical protein
VVLVVGVGAAADPEGSDVDELLEMVEHPHRIAQAATARRSRAQLRTDARLTRLRLTADPAENDPAR